MLGPNWYSHVFLHFWNWLNLFRYWEKTFWYFPRRKDSEIAHTLYCGHIRIFDSKVVLWSIIRRFHSTRWLNRKQLLGIYQKNASNCSFKALMALVPSSFIHWCDALLPAVKMVNQKIEINSFRLINGSWNNSPADYSFRYLGSMLLLSCHQRQIRWDLLNPSHRSTCGHIFLFLYFPAVDKYEKRTPLVNLDEINWANRRHLPVSLQGADEGVKPLPHIFDGDFWCGVLLLGRRWHVLLEADVEEKVRTCQYFPGTDHGIDVCFLLCPILSH